jgi:hypothetical protein
MKKTYLRKLASVLRNWDEEVKTLRKPRGMPRVERFDMRFWCGTGFVVNCGSAACAMGTAMLHPWFIERGLKAKVKVKSPSYSTRYAVPSFDGKEDFAAAARFFGITEDQADWLFAATSYMRGQVTELMVADRIDAFIASGGVIE